MKLIQYLTIFLFALTLLSGCGKSNSTSKEEMDKFLSDSEKIYSLLESAKQEGMRELSFDEDREFVAYEVTYDSETEFQKGADNPVMSLIVTNLSMMRLQLGKTTTGVGVEDSLKEYNIAKESVNKDIAEYKEFLNNYSARWS